MKKINVYRNELARPPGERPNHKKLGKTKRETGLHM